MHCSLPGSSVHGSLQARVPEQVAMSSSRGSSLPRNRTRVSYVSLHWQSGFFNTIATREAPKNTVSLKSTVKQIQHDQDQMHLLVGGNFLQRRLTGRKLGGPACSQWDFSITASSFPHRSHGLASRPGSWRCCLRRCSTLLPWRSSHWQTAPQGSRSACQDCPSQAREDKLIPQRRTGCEDGPRTGSLSLSSMEHLSPSRFRDPFPPLHSPTQPSAKLEGPAAYLKEKTHSWQTLVRMLQRVINLPRQPFLSSPRGSFQVLRNPRSKGGGSQLQKCETSTSLPF